MGTKWALIPLAVVITGWFYYQTLPGSSGFVLDSNSSLGFRYVSFPSYPCHDEKQPIGECLVQELASVSSANYSNTALIVKFGNATSIQNLIKKDIGKEETRPDVFAIRATLQAGTGDMDGAIKTISNIPRDASSIKDSFWPQSHIVRALVVAGKMDAAIKFARATQDISFAIDDMKDKKQTDDSLIRMNPVLIIGCWLKKQGREDEANAFIYETPAESVFYRGYSAQEALAFNREKCWGRSVLVSVDIRNEEILIRRLKSETNRGKQMHLALEVLGGLTQKRSKNINFGRAVWPYALDMCLKSDVVDPSMTMLLHLSSYEECLDYIIERISPYALF